VKLCLRAERKIKKKNTAKLRTPWKSRLIKEAGRQVDPLVYSRYDSMLMIFYRDNLLWENPPRSQDSIIILP
jgi:hypothetical protein